MYRFFVLVSLFLFSFSQAHAGSEILQILDLHPKDARALQVMGRAVRAPQPEDLEAFANYYETVRYGHQRNERHSIANFYRRAVKNVFPQEEQRNQYILNALVSESAATRELIVGLIQYLYTTKPSEIPPLVRSALEELLTSDPDPYVRYDVAQMKLWFYDDRGKHLVDVGLAPVVLRRISAPGVRFEHGIIPEVALLLSRVNSQALLRIGNDSNERLRLIAHRFRRSCWRDVDEI